MLDSGPCKIVTIKTVATSSDRGNAVLLARYRGDTDKRFGSFTLKSTKSKNFALFSYLDVKREYLNMKQLNRFKFNSFLKEGSFELDPSKLKFESGFGKIKYNFNLTGNDNNKLPKLPLMGEEYKVKCKTKAELSVEK